MEYDNNLTGALFKNDRKQTDQHPDYKGSVEVDGKHFWVSAWIKKSKKGVTFMSLNLTPKDEQPASVSSPAAAGDEDAPF